ncbi:MAG: tyrosine-type recombinase/integrase [Acidobacteriaceae bacterium]
MITVWRRHTPKCPHRAKGRSYIKCDCPLWADGWEKGKRLFRQSLATRDMARARKKVLALEDPVERAYKEVAAAVTAFIDHCTSEGLQYSTIRKYRNSLNHLKAFCQKRKIDIVSELTTDALDGFRTSRKLKPITSMKELELLRQFCGFCRDRLWTYENVASRIKSPKNIKPNDVEPFTAPEIAKVIAACDAMGRGPYERLRARGMILTLRYTALRLGDVALLARDRISKDGDRWRVFLRTEKSGKPVFLPIPHELKIALDLVPVPRGSAEVSTHFFWNCTTSKRAVKGIADRTLRSVFLKSGVQRAHAHRFRHTLATELLGRGASFEDVADILGNSPEIVRKHYGKWSTARQKRIDALMEMVHSAADYGVSNQDKATVQ